jgi:SET domain-containing protein
MDVGYGVRATEIIPAGCMIGEYSGVLTTHEFDKDKETTSEYALRLLVKSSRSMVKSTRTIGYWID